MNPHELTLLQDIALSILFASLAAHTARLLRQPLILGYVLGGILLGPAMGLGLVHESASIELISEIGLIFLLFIIGLEINLRELARMGKSMLALGLVQFLGCSALSWLAFRGIFGTSLPGNFDLLYLAVTTSLSSTLIVVKLLHDKFEIHTTSGKLTLGVLILQDIWAILFMAFQPNFADPQLWTILKSLGLGFLLIGSSFFVSGKLLSRVFQSASKNPELVLLTAVAWCFLICGLAEKAGLSKEMGALIAGLSIATFPYGHDVISKLSGVRDFFVTLFFVSLGLKLPLPSPALLGAAALITLIVIAGRLICVAPVVRASGQGLRLGIVTALNLSQISEFSLVIVSLGVTYGHVSGQLQTTVLVSMLFMAVISTYLIFFNNRIAAWLAHFFEKIQRPQRTAAAHHASYPIVLLGCFRDGMAFVETLIQEAPGIRNKLLVVDFNEKLKTVLSQKGIQWAYGDLAHPESLKHLGIESAAMVICSLSDTYLKGTSTQRLLSQIRQLAPQAKITMVADDETQAQQLTENGACAVAVSSGLVGRKLFEILQEQQASLS